MACACGQLNRTCSVAAAARTRTIRSRSARTIAAMVVDCNPTGGCSIVVLTNSNDSGIQYCCNSIVSNTSDIRPACAAGRAPFGIAAGAIMPGVAALSNLSTANGTNTTRTSTNTAGAYSQCPKCEENHDAAIGAGVGVPLGVIAITAIAWALFERRKRVKGVIPVAQASSRPEYVAHKPPNQHRNYRGSADLVELESNFRKRQTVYSDHVVAPDRGTVP
ncbi:hypothetical protein BDW74DRAFT_18097 [Aspergillus multicolor]|uniref:uncharacterized protein n=1 Tax=Aspergillus multicolor TaxID=41759 RepID=UPI003CCCE6DB